MNKTEKCKFCGSVFTPGATPSHYERGQCIEIGAAFDPIIKDKRGNKPGYNARVREAAEPNDPTTWTKVCSISGCETPVKRTGYCPRHHSEYMVGWRAGTGGTVGKRRVHVKKVRPDADPI